MTSFTPTRTPHTGDENPGGSIRHIGGFGSVEFVSLSLTAARSMGEAWRQSDNARTEVGGPRPCHRRSHLAIVSSKLRRTRSVRPGGASAAFFRRMTRAKFDESLFNSGAVPEGSVKLTRLP